MKKHNDMVAEWMKDPAFKAEYDALEDEFAFFEELVRARDQAGLTQAEVASRMGTKPSSVARLEAGGGSKKHSPSLVTLRKYAQAVGAELEIRLTGSHQQTTYGKNSREGQMTTSRRDASKAGKILGSKTSTKNQKSVAASDLAQAKRKKPTAKQK